MNETDTLANLDQEQLVNFALDGFRRILMHYGFWFNEVAHQLGFETASAIEQTVGTKALAINMKRLSKLLGFEVDDKGVPAALRQLPKDDLVVLIDSLGLNWLANDGVWFQAVETSQEMFTAKRCNDSCWTRFSPYEAYRIKQLLDLPQMPGIQGLAQALSFRMYARVNQQTIEVVDDNHLIFRMVDCRVQSARKKKGLQDYPCKSAGLVEYSTFARSIDTRITTECIACPPDEHPEQWFCAWNFRLPE